MSTYVTGDETLIIDGRNITSFGKDRAIDLALPNEAVNATKGLDGSLIYTRNAEGNMGELKVTVYKASTDGRELSKLAERARNPQGLAPSMYIVNGSYTQTKFKDGIRTTISHELKSMAVKTVSNAGANSSEEYQDGQIEFTFVVGEVKITFQ